MMQRRMIGQIQSGSYIIGEQVSDPLADLITKLLHPDDRNRITLRQILKHPWLKSDDQREPLEIFNEFEREKIQAEFIFRDQEIDTTHKVDLRDKALTQKLLAQGHRISETGFLLKNKSKDEAMDDNRLDMCDF